MKKIIFLFVMAFALLDAQAQTLKFDNTNPQIGKPLGFEYNPKGGTLGQNAIRCVVRAFSSKDSKTISEIKLAKVGDSYQGEFVPSDSTHFALFTFFAGETIDENPAGYFTKFYKNERATAMSLFLEGYLYAGLGNRLAKLKTDNEKAYGLYTQAFKEEPALKDKYLNDFLVSQHLVDHVEANKLALQYIDKYTSNGASEKNLTRIAMLYAFLKDKKATDSVNRLIRLNYPKGDVALKFTLDTIFMQQDAYQKEASLQRAITSFGLDLNKPSDLAKVAGSFTRMGIAFLSIKNADKIEEYIDKNPLKQNRAMFYNSFAAPSIKTKSDLEFALRLSKKSLDLMELAMKEEMPAYYKEYYLSRESYLKTQRNSFDSYKNTYAALLAASGKDAAALDMVAVAAKENNYESVELNERYIDLLIRTGKSDQVKSHIEQFVKVGASSPKLKENLKSVYKGSEPFEIYYGKLEKQALALEKAKLAKEMVNLPAPTFALANLKGEKISLANLKGKIVIVDFWATWCGPCIASFPGMQLAVNKYKNNPNVVFLFVNTWERGAEREKLVKDWWASQKYSFNVLLDSNNKNNPDEYDVVEAYKVTAIPTKFIIDGQGNIRFKKVGAPETTEGIVREIDTMISLIGNNK